MVDWLEGQQGSKGSDDDDEDLDEFNGVSSLPVSFREETGAFPIAPRQPVAATQPTTALRSAPQIAPRLVISTNKANNSDGSQRDVVSSSSRYIPRRHRLYANDSGKSGEKSEASTPGRVRWSDTPKYSIHDPAPATEVSPTSVLEIDQNQKIVYKMADNKEPLQAKIKPRSLYPSTEKIERPKSILRKKTSMGSTSDCPSDESPTRMSRQKSVRISSQPADEEKFYAHHPPSAVGFVDNRGGEMSLDLSPIAAESESQSAIHDLNDFSELPDLLADERTFARNIPTSYQKAYLEERTVSLLAMKNSFGGPMTSHFFRI